MYCIIRFGMYAACIVLTGFGHTAALCCQDTHAFPSSPPLSPTPDFLYIEKCASPESYVSKEATSSDSCSSPSFCCEELPDSSDSDSSYNDDEKLHAGKKRTYAQMSTPKPLAITVVDNVSKLSASARNDPGSLTPYENLLNLNTPFSSQNFGNVPSKTAYLTVWNNAFSGSRLISSNTTNQRENYGKESTESIIAYATCQEIKKHLEEHRCTADQFMALIEKRYFHPKSISAFAKRLNNDTALLNAIVGKIKQLPESKGYKKDEYCKAITQAMDKKKVVKVRAANTLSSIIRGVAEGKCPDNILKHYEVAHASPSSVAHLVCELERAIAVGKIKRTRIDELVTYYKKPENNLKNSSWLYSLIKISSFAQNPQTQEQMRDTLEALTPTSLHILVKKRLPLPADFFNLFGAKKSPAHGEPYDQKYFYQYARLIKAYQSPETCSAMVNHLEKNPCISDEITTHIIDILKFENTANKKHKTLASIAL